MQTFQVTLTLDDAKMLRQGVIPNNLAQQVRRHLAFDQMDEYCRTIGHVACLHCDLVFSNRLRLVQHLRDAFNCGLAEAIERAVTMYS